MTSREITQLLLVSLPAAAQVPAPNYTPPPTQAQRDQADAAVWSALLPGCKAQFDAAVAFQVTMLSSRENAEARFRRPYVGISQYKADVLTQIRDREAKRVADVANDPYPAVRASASDAAFTVCMFNSRLKQAPVAPPPITSASAPAFPGAEQRAANDAAMWAQLISSSCQAQLNAAQAANARAGLNVKPELGYRKPYDGISWYTTDGLLTARAAYAKVVSVALTPDDGAGAGFYVCMFDARLRQLGSTPAPVVRPQQTYAQSTSPPVPAQTPAPVTAPGALTFSQIQACTADIAAAQTRNMNERRAGTGPASDITLYTYQIELFQGRCAGHPEARIYVSNGQKYLAEARARLGTGSQVASAAPPPAAAGGSTSTGLPSPSAAGPSIPKAPPPPPTPTPAQPVEARRQSEQQQASNAAPLKPLATSTPSEQHNPAGEATDCIKVVGREQFASNGIKSAVSDRGFLNTCKRAVSIVWCVEGADCDRGYSNAKRIGPAGDPAAVGFWPIVLGSRSTRVYWAGCYNGFLESQYKLSPQKMHACK